MIGSSVKLSVFFLALFVAGVLPLSVRAAEDSYLDSIELNELLHNHQYPELEQRLSDVQKRYEEGLVGDSVVMLAFKALANSDPAHEVLLNGWVEAMPNSFAALAARGMYYVDVSWSLRGTTYARKSSKAQFSRMRDYHKRGLFDMQMAVASNPAFIAGYAEIISASKSSSNDALLNETLQRVLEFDPRSYVVRKAHLLGLMPRWGGSFKSIGRFFEDTRK